MFGKVLACLFMLAVICVPSQAGSKKSITKYVHYQVAGLSAPDILKSLHSRGPKVGGFGAYATTIAEYPKKPIEFSKTPESCKIRNFDYQMHFTIKLPRLNAKNVLSGRTASAWSGFEQFVKAHEETHRSIWLNCAQDHARQVQKLSGANCNQVEAAAAKLWEKNKIACNKRHVSFDASERSRLKRQPLILMASDSR